MNDFLRNLISPGWWFGVVIVSFLINLAAVYAKPVIDRIASGMSQRWRRKVEKARGEFERQAAIIERTPDGVVLTTLEEIMLVLGATLFVSFSILILVFLSIPIPSLPSLRPPTSLLLFVPILLILATVCLHQAGRKSALLKILKSKHEHQ
jgi:hypothetical protein